MSLQVQVLIYNVSAIFCYALIGYINGATEGVLVVMTQLLYMLITLLNILERKFRITDVALKWFKSYLQNRGIRVCVNNVYSTRRAYIFGATRIHKWTSTIQCIFFNHKISYWFGDHSKCLCWWPFSSKITYTSPRSGDTNHQQLESNLWKVENWMNTNRLKLNVSTMEFVLFGIKFNLENVCQTT